MSPDSGAAMPD